MVSTQSVYYLVTLFFSRLVLLIEFASCTLSTLDSSLYLISTFTSSQLFILHILLPSSHLSSSLYLCVAIISMIHGSIDPPQKSHRFNLCNMSPVKISSVHISTCQVDGHISPELISIY